MEVAKCGVRNGGRVSCQWAGLSAQWPGRRRQYRVTWLGHALKNSCLARRRLRARRIGNGERGAAMNCAHVRDGVSIYGRFLENSRRWSKGALEHLRTPEVNIYGKFSENWRRWSYEGGKATASVHCQLTGGENLGGNGISWR